MNDTTASLRHKFAIVDDLQGVVRTMKTLAASSIGQYERSVAALADYARTVDDGPGLCLRQCEPAALQTGRSELRFMVSVVPAVFGAD